MNSRVSRWAAVAAMLAALFWNCRSAEASQSRGDEYQTIIDRNPFNLKPMPPPQTNNPAAAQPPKTDIKLTGITTFGTKKAYFMIAGPKPEYYTLGVGEGKDGLEVMEIDDANKTVRVRNGGVETSMTFASHGVASPNTGPAPAHGAPGAPGAPGTPPTVVPNPAVPSTVTTAYNMPATPGMAPNAASAIGGARTVIPSRMLRTPAGDVVSGAPGGAASLPVITAPAPPNPNNLSGEQQIIMLELQKIAAQRSNPRAVMPPTPGLPGQ